MSLNNKYILKYSVPIGFAYIILGFTFGALFSAKGGTTFEAFLIATFCFAGAAQFVALEFYHKSFSIYVMFFTIFVLNLRHILYGFSFMKSGHQRKDLYLFLALTDENFAVSTHYSEMHPSRNDWIKIFALNHTYWILGCTLGSLLPITYIESLKGADFSLIALFVAIFASSIKNKRNKI